MSKRVDAPDAALGASIIAETHEDESADAAAAAAAAAASATATTAGVAATGADAVPSFKQAVIPEPALEKKIPAMTPQDGREHLKVVTKIAKAVETQHNDKTDQAQIDRQVLDPTLFVGYVEEFETPEMIEMKFKKLEEIEQRLKRDREKAAAAATGSDSTPGRATTPSPPPTSVSQDQASESAGAVAENADAESGSGNDAETNSAGPSGADADADVLLDRAALLEVFKQTSNFTVENATRQHEMGDEYMYDDGWDMGHVTTHETNAGERVFLFGDGTDDELWDELFGKKKKGRTARAPQLSNRTTSVSKIVANGVMHIAFVADTSGRFVTGLKKIRMYDPNAIMYTRIPKEITPSWAKRVAPYRPKGAVHRHTKWRPDEVCLDEDTFSMSPETPPCSKHVQVDSVLDADLLGILGNRAPLEGIVLSPPWKHARKLVHNSSAGKIEDSNPNNLEYGIEPEDLLRLKLNRKGLLPSGFVYIWTPKHLILRVLRALEKMDLHYVENAVYVKQHVHNEFYCEASPYFRQSKDTLLICRKGKKNKSGKIAWSKVEIRHQRTSDVHFEFLRREQPDGGPHLYAHGYVQNMVETMLPHARFNPLPKAELPKASAPEVGIAASATIAPEDGEASPGADQQDMHETPEIPDTGSAKVCEPFAGVGPGKLLHLWAPAKQQRTGWVSVSESRASQSKATD
ncbi:Hypothetical Protein FCC1311_054252 [Hondaea fermentalgiana]|uniref:Uncharacterized protein n=1 Tax=Hondaea fermentalgiana TaxID=2315210 RepID=A0A2R5GKQ5_9STRA|nr:Hypothetical Protein FCC1311_054252 [Hondaea fermentalgiana]|eukprot:GBG29203.1 Hypothetical Protein FCC1311_054252 [Hondaea fermentalgiana]